jgi:tetratricopeptide (TPR) repeat protein
MGRRCRHLITLLLWLGVLCSAQAREDADALIQQALQQSEAGKLNEAQALLNRALELVPDSSLAYTRLGGIQLLQQQYRAGIDSFQQAIMLDGENSEAFIGISIAYLHLGRYALAREALKEASRLGPEKHQEINSVLTWLEQRERPAGH